MRNDAVWQARVDLAAAYRLAVLHGLNEGICNHFTVLVPGHTDRFLLIPYGRMAHGAFRLAALVRHAVERRRPNRLGVGED